MVAVEGLICPFRLLPLPTPPTPDTPLMGMGLLLEVPILLVTHDRILLSNVPFVSHPHIFLLATLLC